MEASPIHVFGTQTKVSGVGMSPVLSAHNLFSESGFRMIHKLCPLSLSLPLSLVTPLGGHEERRDFLGVGSVGQQQLNDCLIASAGGYEERCGTTVFSGQIGIGSVCQQQPNNCLMAVDSGTQERCGTILFSQVGVGSVGQQ